MDVTEAAPVLDLASEAASFREAVLEGLARRPKAVPCKFLYDARGSDLFERICGLEEYYPTRTEKAIMQAHGAAMAEAIGPRALVIEYGSGSSDKTRLLLDALEAPAGYVPIDISRSALEQAARRLARRYPALPVRPVCADYTEALTLPDLPGPAARRVVYFPGSTIGNFEPARAGAFLARMAEAAGAGGGLLIGVDLKKSAHVLEAAYNDRAGVTAAFNKNLLRRINRELGGQFDLDRFAHRAVYDAARGCIEMRLVSRAAQAVRVDGHVVRFAAGEHVRTERSYKYAPEGFAALAARAGLHVEQVWTDDAGLFSVQLLAPHASKDGQRHVMRET